MLSENPCIVTHENNREVTEYMIPLDNVELYLYQVSDGNGPRQKFW